MKKLTLEIVNKIINNCKDEGSYFSGINETKDTDLEVWDIPVYCDISKEFIRYTLVKIMVSNEYEEYTEYSLEQDCDGEYIDYDFALAIDPEYTDYNLSDWLSEYEEDLETNEEVIRLVEEYEGLKLIINN